jgi:hypothetical protein
MGYSGRYHAASLAAVFIALAMGILIGIGLADDVVSTVSQELEQSIKEERDQAEEEAAELRGQLETEQGFSEDAYPALVAGKLTGERFAVIELGDVPGDEVDDTADEAIDAAETAGGELSMVASIELPPDLRALAAAAEVNPKQLRRDEGELERLGRRIGGQLAGGGELIDRVRPALVADADGSFEDVSRLIFVRNPPAGLGEDAQAAYDAFERGLIEGAAEGEADVVGVERISTDPTTLGTFSDLGVPTVDNIETPPGKVAMVYALDGASGDFGVKDAASGLVPDLPPEQSQP